MDKEIKQKVLASIENLKNKNCRIYLMVNDTKGFARASVKYIYDIAMVLKENGYNSIILHEKNDYVGVSKWLNNDYMEKIPHKSIESQNLEISPEDFIIVPEVFGYVMEQLKNLPCGKIVLSQSYSYIVDTLKPGQSWAQLGFMKCITTSNKQKEYIESIMRNVSYDILEPTISDYFEPKNKPALPIIAIHTREHSDTTNIIKFFYLKFPQYRWFTFRDMRGLSEKEFAETLKDCFLSVWIDNESSFGTFPLESMACGVPVLAKIPDLPPSWMQENNGLWVTDKTLFPDYIADFIQNWLEDNIKPDLYEEMIATANKFKNKSEFEKQVITLFESYINVRRESLESQIEKIEE